MIVPVKFEEHVIGNVRLDLVIDDEIIVELKSIAKLNDTTRLQLKKYLEITDYKAGASVFRPSGLNYRADRSAPAFAGILVNFPASEKPIEIEHFPELAPNPVIDQSCDTDWCKDWKDYELKLTRIEKELDVKDQSAEECKRKKGSR